MKIKITDIDGYQGGGGSGSLPTGGVNGQVLTKASSTDGDATWKFPVTSGTTSSVHPFWRLYSLANNNDSYTGLRELQFVDSTGAILPTNTGSAIAGGDDGQNPPANAFDGNTGTVWQIQSSNNVSIGYNFPSPVGVVGVKLMANRFTGQTPSSFRVEWSDDGITYNTAWTVSTGSSGWSDYEVRTFIDPASGTPKKPVPNGGATGQVLTKASNTDQDVIWSATPYRFGGFFTSSPSSLEVLNMHVATDGFMLPANLVGTQFKVGVSPSNTVALALFQNGNSVATVNITSAGVVSLSTTNAVAITVAAGDLLTLIAPSDSLGLASTAFTFKGYAV